MADEDEVRELIGRMTAAQRQGFHVTPGALRIVLAALRFYLAARAWLAKPHGDPHDDAPRKKPERYTGPPATIGNSRRLGLVACLIECSGLHCHRQTRFTYDELGLPDDAVFLDIPRLRRFRCSRCGCRQVIVSADWRDHKAQGNGQAF